MKGTHRVTFAPKVDRGFITSSNTSTVKMFNLKTVESLADISAGKRVDSKTHVLVSAAKSTFATLAQPD